MSNRPDNALAYDELDLKLGIKSSLPHVKSTLALAVLFWEAADKPAVLNYSQQNERSLLVSAHCCSKRISIILLTEISVAGVHFFRISVSIRRSCLT